jgi:hypothetical protein
MWLIRWKAEDGTSGSCNARCYNNVGATSKSVCICTGVNRGVGFAVAVQNTQLLYKTWVKTQQDKRHTVISYSLAPVCQYVQQYLWEK